MAYASQSGRAKTSATSPNAFAVCDRCGIWYNFKDLQWQWDWSGAQLRNLWLLVCNRCCDTPQSQLRAIVVPADPLPIVQARVQDFSLASDDLRTLSPNTTDPITGIPIPNTTYRVTQDGNSRVTQSVGPTSHLIPEAPGLSQNAQMPLSGTVAYGVPISLLSVTANGTYTVSVTCSAANTLATGDQISAEGLSAANGFYNVTVLSPMAFTYTASDLVAPGSLLLSGSRIITANAGITRDYAQVPQSGI